MFKELMFGHEKFQAYQYAIEFVALSTQIIEELPKGFAKLADQFRRASIAVPLNIAEGSGRRTTAEKNHCYVIARGEAMECAAVIDVLTCLKLLDSQRADTAKTLLKNVVSILTAVCSNEVRVQISEEGEGEGKDEDEDKDKDKG